MIWCRSVPLTDLNILPGDLRCLRAGGAEHHTALRTGHGSWCKSPPSSADPHKALLSEQHSPHLCRFHFLCSWRSVCVAGDQVGRQVEGTQIWILESDPKYLDPESYEHRSMKKLKEEIHADSRSNPSFCLHIHCDPRSSTYFSFIWGPSLGS